MGLINKLAFACIIFVNQSAIAENVEDSVIFDYGSFLCIPNQIVGFAFDSNQGKIVSGSFSNHSGYVISPISRDEYFGSYENLPTPYQLRQYNTDEIVEYCDDGFSAGKLNEEWIESDYLFCVNNTPFFVFNRRTLEFIESYNYMNFEDKASTIDDQASLYGPNPYLSIGTCHPLH